MPPASFLLGLEPGNRQPLYHEGCVKKALSLGCRVVATNHRFMTRRLASEARRRGLFVCCWTVNDPKRGEKLAGAGINGIITDKPDLL